MSTPSYTRATKRAIAAYGREACLEAYRMHRQGEGAATIAFCGPATITTTRQADAAINAGEEIMRPRLDICDVNEACADALAEAFHEGREFTRVSLPPHGPALVSTPLGSIPFELAR